MIAFTALAALFVSGTFVPSIPEIARDLDTTPDVVSMAVSVSVLCVALGSMTFSSYSTCLLAQTGVAQSLVGLPLLSVGSFGVAWSHNTTELFCWRVVQALGASPGFSVGSGVVGDIYKLEERGFAMGVFTGAALLGPALAPVAGGWAAHYSSWRHMQEAIGVAGFVTFVIMYFSFAETKHPKTKGIEKARLRAQEEGRKPPRFVFLNPIGPMALLKSPVMLFTCIVGYTALVSDFVLVIPIAYTIHSSYSSGLPVPHLDNPFRIALYFVPMGVGNFIGAPLAGRYSDYMVVKWRAHRNGIWYPEDRMRATTPGLGVLIPLMLIACGLTTHFFFFNGIGIDCVLSAVNSYCVDIMHEQSAEAISATQASARCSVR
ncbi:major facilitator superfamily domain-containing protein [Schizophyllum amplum]|uniref:Major facilitator superfamily domain-containing protein n=1 Tax=Schizophyllum amplum TaxID=97359 RepID=A0A550C4A1_9AGAR|nr:major facilitator superfamily domain-containing protein [Auriculariopsis ampla]